MITLIILISIYILSAISWWLLVHYTHNSNKESAKFNNPGKAHIISTLVPIWNTLCILIVIAIILESKWSEAINPVKFFKIK